MPGALILDLARTMREVPSLAITGRAILDRWETSWARAARRAGSSSTWSISCYDRARRLALKDIQWADDLSLETIAEIPRRAASKPILLLVVHRPDDSSEDARTQGVEARLLTQRLAEEVRLDRFTRAQTAAVVSLLIIPGCPRRAMWSTRSRPNPMAMPLHIEELGRRACRRSDHDAAAIRGVGAGYVEDAVRAAGPPDSPPEAQAVARAGR